MRERTVEQTRVSIDGSSFVLASAQDVEDLCAQLEAAVRTAGAVVRFTTVDARMVRALITPHSHVLITDESVTVDGDDSVLTLTESGNWDLL